MTSSGPFVHHLKEAIVINWKRLPRYASISGGKTVPHSMKLIFSEKISLPFAFTIDRLARPYQKAGIPIGDLEFISMEKIPEFSEHFPFSPEPLSAFVRVDGKGMAKKMKWALATHGFAGELRKIEPPRAYHCMLRHVLESVLRMANLAPLHEKRAKELGFESPLISCAKLSRMMLWGHIISLAPSAEMDAKAAPLQAQGIPIIWQDVPHIPPASEFYSAV